MWCLIVLIPDLCPFSYFVVSKQLVANYNYNTCAAKASLSNYCLCFTYFQRNVKEIMDANGIKVLVDLLTLAHLHITRATVPTQVKKKTSNFISSDSGICKCL